MSTEEIIRIWKNLQQPARPLFSTQEPGQAPANPVGEQELSDEELEIIEGGLLGSHDDTCGTTVV